MQCQDDEVQTILFVAKKCLRRTYQINQCPEKVSYPKINKNSKKKNKEAYNKTNKNASDQLQKKLNMHEGKHS